jgi:hypothetical protein
VRIFLALALTTTIALHVSAAEKETVKSSEKLPELFKADFSSDLSAWTMTDPAAWKIVEEEGDKKLSLFGASDYRAPVRSPHNIARVKDVDVTDFVMDVEGKQTGREYGHRDLCFFFGYQDPSHFYYVHLATTADAHANSIFLVNGAPRVSIAQKRTNGTDWKQGYHHIRIARNTESGTIKVYFNDMDSPVMETVDKTFLNGTIGVGSFDDTGNFDDFTIHGVATEK